MTTYAGTPSKLFINTKREQYNNNVKKDESEFDFFEQRRKKQQMTQSVHKNKAQTCVLSAEKTQVNKKRTVKPNNNVKSISKKKTLKKTNVKSTKKAFVTSSKVPEKAVKSQNKKAKSITSTRPINTVSKVKTNKPKIVVVTKKVENKKPFPITFISYAAVFTILFMFMLSGLSQINEHTLEIGRMRSKINEQYKEQARLQIMIDSRDDLRYIEETAVEKLGMVKSDKLTKQYVSISGNDKTQVTRAERNSLDMGVVLSGASELLGAIFGSN